MKTGELSKRYRMDRTGLNYYRKIGLLEPINGDNGYSEYSFSDLVALEYARYYRGMGFTIDECEQLIKHSDSAGKEEACLDMVTTIEREMKALKYRRTMVLHHINSLHLFRELEGKMVIGDNQGFYFLSEKHINSDDLDVLYKLTPYLLLRLNETSCSLPIEEWHTESGVSFMPEWVEEFEIPHVDKMKYYERSICLSSVYRWHRTDGEQVIKDYVKRMYTYAKKAGYSIKREMVGFVFNENYGSENEIFEFYFILPLD